MEKGPGSLEVGLWLSLPKARQQVGPDKDQIAASGNHRKVSPNLSGQVVQDPGIWGRCAPGFAALDLGSGALPPLPPQTTVSCFQR